MCAVNRPQPKKLHLKKIASETVFKTNNEVYIRDILALVKNLPIRKKEKSLKLRRGGQAFVKILMHSLRCAGSCKNPKCLKMKLIQDHFNKCSRNGQNGQNGQNDPNGQNCAVCGQFIALLTPFMKKC